MRKINNFLSFVVLGIAAVACGSPAEMAKQSENVNVSYGDAVLEVIAGEINTEVTVTYPEDYFHPKAILEVTPVIVYEGGEVAMGKIVVTFAEPLHHFFRTGQIIVGQTQLGQVVGGALGTIHLHAQLPERLRATRLVEMYEHSSPVE